jgi:tungstate transport system substrate-binding protein
MQGLFTVALWIVTTTAIGQQPFIVVASTTSTEQSGLFGRLLPEFEKDTGISVRVVAVGTGQALDIGRRGDADVVFVHDKPAELKWLEEGNGVKRYPVMYNDFVLIGPSSDPAHVKSGKDIAVALMTIAETKAAFVSRADKSGTYAAELRLWKDAGVDIDKAKGRWYRETGQGMGPALNTASATTLEEAEREHILKALRESNWVLAGPKGAASRLGMKLTSLQSMLQYLGIRRREQ